MEVNKVKKIDIFGLAFWVLVTTVIWTTLALFFFDRINGIESAGSEVDVIHEYYSGQVIEEIKEGAEGSNFDKVVVFADGSKSYIKLNCDEDKDCEVEELE